MVAVPPTVLPPTVLPPTVLGKPGYAPLEQMRNGTVSYHSDLYALAVTAIVLMTGKIPQQLTNPDTLDWTWEQELKLSPRLTKILKRMLAPIPGDRFQSSREVLQALRSTSMVTIFRILIKGFLVVGGLGILAVVFWCIIIPLLFPEPNSSIGRDFLNKNALTTAQKAGREAFCKGDYSKTIPLWQNYLKRNPNDQETRIYLENAKVIDKNPITIAIVVPIARKDINQNIAREMLRGVGLAQYEINKKGGINSRFLQVIIVNDDNDPDKAKQVAEELVKDPRILAIVGHNASAASLAAVSTYQKAGLLMVSPTSFADELSNHNNIVRTIFPVRSMVEPLVQYALKAKKTKVVICYDSQSTDQVEFQKEFANELQSESGTVVPTTCNFSSPTFNAKQVIDEAVKSGADSILLAASIAPNETLKKALEVGRANQGRLALFASPTINTYEKLQDVNGVVFTAPWHRQTPLAQAFANRSYQLWGGDVNWRTATTFDATVAIIKGLEMTPSPTRAGLLTAIRSNGFSAPGGANGEPVKFLSGTGDRLGKAILVQVQKTDTGYQPVPIQP